MENTSMQEIQTQQEQYPWLKDLELGAENQGCYRDGEWKATGGGEVTSINPHNNKPIGKTFLASVDDYDKCVKAMQTEKARWFKLPAPARGEIVR
jgi:acyl-CoA reductase-like NAD-dependent aldehyde dehydrogenase